MLIFLCLCFYGCVFSARLDISTNNTKCNELHLILHYLQQGLYGLNECEKERSGINGVFIGIVILVIILILGVIYFILKKSCSSSSPPPHRQEMRRKKKNIY